MTLGLPQTPEERDIERQLEARDKWHRALRDARRTTAVRISGLGDMNAMAYNYGSLHEVVQGYMRGQNNVYDHELVTQENPLRPYLENLERRHR